MKKIGIIKLLIIIYVSNFIESLMAPYLINLYINFPITFIIFSLTLYNSIRFSQLPKVKIWKIRKMGICASKGPNEPIWTTCPHCETRVLTRIITETYGCTIKFWFCCIPVWTPRISVKISCLLCSIWPLIFSASAAICSWRSNIPGTLYLWAICGCVCC